MKISGGKERGRRLRVPSGARIRPTSDKVKQALFNILGDRVAGAAFLDLYAGAGGIGIEALSRDADRVVFVEAANNAVRFIQQNLERVGVRERARVIHADAVNFLKKHEGSYDIIFLDPPYTEDLGPLLEGISEAGILKPGAIVIAEHFRKQLSPERAGTLVRDREKRYGDTVLSFYTLEK